MLFHMLDPFRVAQGLSGVASVLGHEVFPASLEMLGFSCGEVSLKALRVMETGRAAGKVEMETSGVTFGN